MSDYDKTWDEIYNAGRHLNLYPYDSVVSFLYRNRVAEKKQSVLEVGCGAGNNLWFAAREGFEVHGFDASQSAIQFARKRFHNEGLSGSLEVNLFSDMGYPNNHFDFAIDRCALTHTKLTVISDTISKIYDCLKPNGKFFMCCFSTKHDSFKESKFDKENHYSTEVIHGAIKGVGGICFMDKKLIEELFSQQAWTIESITHEIKTEQLANDTQALWTIIAVKTDKRY